MKGSARISDRVFGFHAQQAVEKALKAWLALVGIDFPKIHDLDELCGLIQDKGQSLPDTFRELTYLTDFAVGLRYTVSAALGRRMDRPSLVGQISQVIEHVERLAGAAGQSS
jgi:HEPN domain-containing protein